MQVEGVVSAEREGVWSQGRKASIEEVMAAREGLWSQGRRAEVMAATEGLWRASIEEVMAAIEEVMVEWAGVVVGVVAGGAVVASRAMTTPA